MTYPPANKVVIKTVPVDYIYVSLVDISARACIGHCLEQATMINTVQQWEYNSANVLIWKEANFLESTSWGNGKLLALIDPMANAENYWVVIGHDSSAGIYRSEDW
ncbi:hypothetical protein F5141DRAFT_1060127 [Pisolithus sp. B1]|nr:hypothetical protein F5141DRAFT_1060127 [Pisolithus sp. B1]